MTENIWIKWLAWLPAQARLSLGSAVALILWSGFLGGQNWILYSTVSKAMNLASLPRQGSRMGTKASTAYC